MNALPIGKIQALTARVVENAQDAALTATITTQLAAARVVANAHDIALDATTAAHVTAARVEKKLLELPRPLKSRSVDQLVDLLANYASGILAGAYMLKTGKFIAFGLVDRRINKLGRVSIGIGVAMSTALMPLLIHELWARQRELVNNPKKAAAMDFAMNASWSQLGAELLRNPVDPDLIDGLAARASANRGPKISDLTFDQIIKGEY